MQQILDCFTVAEFHIVCTARLASAHDRPTFKNND